MKLKKNNKKIVFISSCFYSFVSIKKRKKDETANRPHKYFNHNYKQDILIFFIFLYKYTIIISNNNNTSNF